LPGRGHGLRSRQPPQKPETVIVDVIDEPAPGIIRITEIEETEVHDVKAGADEPEESGSALPKSEGQ
jgi:hypothetical protein